MKGADEYCKVFRDAEQIGRLYLLPSRHARGATFRIFVLPAGEAVIKNHCNPPLNTDAVEVYGVVSGNPGWTETYGWLRTGKWQDDFEDIYKSRLEAMRTEEIKREAEKKASDVERNNRSSALLSDYA